MSYYRTDAKKLAQDIRKAIPEAMVENWRDHGFAVDVWMPAQPGRGHKACVACEPPRDDIGRPEVFRSVDEVKQILGVIGSILNAS
jgi:hypothetical protein